MKVRLIAPCGMNCNLCMAYLRDKRRCPGCRDIGHDKSKSCRNCIIKNCKELAKNNLKYCSEKCHKFPCLRLRNLDKRYRTKYSMSMLENLEIINKQGIRKLISIEKGKWIKDDMIFCVHHKKYYDIRKS